MEIVQPAGESSGEGTVETITIATANGFAGTSDGDPVNPTLTLSTTVTGILQGNGTAISAITVGAGLSFAGGTLSASAGAGTLAAVSALSNDTAKSTYTTTPGVTTQFIGTDGSPTAGVLRIINDGKDLTLGQLSATAGKSSAITMVDRLGANVFNLTTSGNIVLGENGGSTWIGTASGLATSPLTVHRTGIGILARLSSSVADNMGFIEYWGNGARKAFLGFGASGLVNNNFSINNNTTGGGIILATNNTARMTVEVGGDIGFGIENPTSPFHFQSNTTDAFLLSDGDGNTVKLNANFTGTGSTATDILSAFRTGIRDVRIQTIGSGFRLWDNSGSAPAPLTCGTITTGTFTSNQVDNGGATEYQRFRYTAGANYFQYYTDDGVSNRGGYGWAAGSGDWQFRVNGSNSISAGTQALVLKSTGDVYTLNELGVGVDTPLAKIHVLGTTEQLRTAYNATNYLSTTVSSTGATAFAITSDNGTPTFSFNKDVDISAINLITDTTTGTKIAIATSQKLGFWNATPIVQPTTAVAEATFVENAGGTAVNVDSTFGGYTLQQVVQALQNAGLLA